MKLQTTMKWCVALAIGGFIPWSAQAVTINNDYLIGTVVPGTPSDTATELIRLQFLVAQYNLGNTGDLGDIGGDSGTEVATLFSADDATDNVPNTLPSPVVLASGQVGGSQTGTQAIDFGAGYEYLMVKWGNDDAFYYVGGLTGSHTVSNAIILNSGNGNPLGASHYVLFNGTSQVPDGGATLILFGLALSGFGLLKKRRS